jgi:hypothetical protein
MLTSRLAWEILSDTPVQKRAPARQSRGRKVVSCQTEACRYLISCRKGHSRVYSADEPEPTE